MINIQKLIVETFADMVLNDPTAEIRGKVKGLELKLKVEFPQLADLSLYITSGGEELHLNSINVKPNFRGQGIGGKVMDKIIDFADENGLYITLKPNPQSGYKSKLLKFYKRFGFYPNKGRRGISKYGGAFGIYWIRPPRKKVQKISEIINEYEKGESLKFYHDCYDSHGGESFCNLIAKDINGKPVGYIEYSIFDKEINIKMIQTKEGERRKGIATLMAKELKNKYPESFIHWGMTTSDGEPFVRSLRKSIYGHKEITTKDGTLKYVQEGNVARIWDVRSTTPRSGFFTKALSQLKADGIKTIIVNIQSANMRKALKSLVNNGILSNPRNMVGISVDEHPSTFDILNEITSPYEPAKDTDVKRGYIGTVYGDKIIAYDEMIPNVMEVDHSELPHGRSGSRWRYFVQAPTNTVLWNEFPPSSEDKAFVTDWLETKGVRNPKHIGLLEYRYIYRK